MKTLTFSLFLLSATMMFAQENNTEPITDISKVFEKVDPQEEIYRLEEKRATLSSRLFVLKENEEANYDEIYRVEGMIQYIDKKIESLNKILVSEQYADDMGMPEQGDMSDEEYRQKKEEWQAEQDEKTNDGNQPEMVIKTTLTRYEFEKLPADRQEKIVSMPERYTIID